MKIFLDFDDVLFNTKKFIQDEIDIFRKYGISEEIFKKHYYQYGKNKKGKIIKKYNLKKQLQGIKKELNINIDNIENELRIFLSIVSRYIFSDTVLFLKQFERKELFLISYSKTEFQKLKIKNSGLANYFEKIKITNGNKEEEMLKFIGKNKKEELFFIDDRVDYILKVKKKIPQIKTILLKRKEGRYDNEKNKYCDFVAKNLKQALKIIKND
ncbi:MAG: hypothetical protein COX29_02535 [Candidatus Moranbacteria bacterium CG23_combo_of_CG06-09_8_20_14_all_35_22]|nr:MAG: hypothetical protein COX29_02535 [Candidatus Moranbacteria bacterium CG23_combo_of_CG06-09_8_20_14_all_35_22]